MKTIQQIMDFTRKPEDIITDLRTKHHTIPAWSGKLENEYNPRKHPVFTDPKYLDNESKGIRLCRVAFGWQKLATKRMAELTFGIPVKRIWKTDTEQHRRAARLIESIFRKNRIDSVNLDRAKKLYASCEFATIWYNQPQPTVYGGEKCIHKIRCKTYSPMAGDHIYPLFDDYDDLIALSIEYTRTVGIQTVTYFETYTAQTHMRWRKQEDLWLHDINPEQVSIRKIAGIYAQRPEPIWEDESPNVYESEWEISRNGNYLKKNSAPIFKIFADPEDLARFRRENPDETSKDARKILYFPKDAQASYETWQQSIDTLKFQSETIRRNFFMQLQIPDMSFESMKSTPMSGEARKMMFVDTELKVMDESGIWIDSFFRECSVVKEFAKLACPSLASDIDTLELEDVIITPYRISDQNETITNLTAATGGQPIMSQRTAISRLGEVDDPDQELQQINAEKATSLEEIAF